MHRTFATLLALGLVAAGCDDTTTEPVTAVPSGAATLQTQAIPDSVARHLYSGIKDRRRLVIRDAATWTQLWNEVTAQVQPRPAVPQIDFAREMIVLASMGSRPSGGFSIEIPSVSEAGGQRYVVVRETSPAPNCIVTGALTAPVIAVRVPQHGGSTSFVEETRTRSCG